MTRQPERIGDILDGVLERLGVGSAPDMVDLVGRWAELAGEPWATRSIPAGYHRGVLTVEVTDGEAATLLKYQTQELVTRLGEALGSGIVTTVRIRVARPGRQR